MDRQTYIMQIIVAVRNFATHPRKREIALVCALKDTQGELMYRDTLFYLDPRLKSGVNITPRQLYPVAISAVIFK
jgi:hypothetical protein